MVQRQPTDQFRETIRGKRNLIRPLRMRPDRTLMKPAELHAGAEMSVDLLPENPGGIAACRIEIDMGMPVFDAVRVKNSHIGLSLGRR